MMVRIKNTARKVFKPPLPVVPYRCAVCQLTFNHRQNLSRHYKQQHKLPNAWDQLAGRTPMSALQMASLSASLSVSAPLLSTLQLSALLSSAPLLTDVVVVSSAAVGSSVLMESTESAAGSQPSTSAAAWADEAVTAVHAILPVTPATP